MNDGKILTEYSSQRDKWMWQWHPFHWFWWLCSEGVMIWPFPFSSSLSFMSPKVNVISCFWHFSFTEESYTAILYWNECCIHAQEVISHFPWEWDPSSFLVSYSFVPVLMAQTFVFRRIYFLITQADPLQIYYDYFSIFYLKCALYLCLLAVGRNVIWGKL